MKLNYPDWSRDLPLEAQTPYYLYSEKLLESLWKSFEQEVLKNVPDLHLHFAIKANNNPDLLKFFKSKGAGVDVVSYFEAEIAKKNGFSPSQCVFSGVGKSDKELGKAIDDDIFLINIESRSEFLKLQKISRAKKKSVCISFRVNPDVDAKTHPYIATGLFEHKFGLDFKSAKELYLESLDDPYLKCRGISVHIGSQLFDLSVLDEALELTISFAQELKTNGLSLKFFDVGGGLGVNYKTIDEIPKFSEYGKILQKHSIKWKSIFGPKASLISECGRALCAQAGFLVSRVIGLKSNIKKNFAIIDASMTELMRPALYQSEHPMLALTEATQIETYDVVGPVCESSDVLAKKIELPRLEENTPLIILGCGAYGYVMANHYNGRPLPEEWWLPKDSKPRLSRPLIAF